MIITSNKAKAKKIAAELMKQHAMTKLEMEIIIEKVLRETP